MVCLISFLLNQIIIENQEEKEKKEKKGKREKGKKGKRKRENYRNCEIVDGFYTKLLRMMIIGYCNGKGGGGRRKVGEGLR